VAGEEFCRILGYFGGGVGTESRSVLHKIPSRDHDGDAERLLPWTEFSDKLKYIHQLYLL
jgi:hypothetical protein